jgi:hypothetical protein
VVAHIPLSQLRQLPGAADLEDAWIHARLGEDGYLAGQDAAAACDAQIVPVVTGTMDPPVIDQMIDLARIAAQAGAPGPGGPRSSALSPEAWRALRHAMARLAVDLASGPVGVAAILRQHLLTQPFNTPSLPLDIGYSHAIPWHIRRAVLLRDKKCAWPKCGRPAVYCDVHHLRHKQDGGETTLANLILVCQLCRRRHNRHYAELRVMPLRGCVLGVVPAYGCVSWWRSRHNPGCATGILAPGAIRSRRRTAHGCRVAGAGERAAGGACRRVCRVSRRGRVYAAVCG